MSRTHSEGLEPGAWKIIAVAILGPFMSNMDSTVRLRCHLVSPISSKPASDYRIKTSHFYG
jgi:hypothetical protein